MSSLSTFVVLMSMALFAAVAPSHAAAGKSAAALVEEAIKHEHAEGKVRSYEQAHRLYCEAARQDSADAFLRLGWMYANGRGVARNDGVAHLLFSRAGKLGSEIGSRLAGMIGSAAGAQVKPPACLVAAAPGGGFADGADLDNPARFLTAPRSPALRKLMNTVVAQAREFGVDPRLVVAVMRAESNFDSNARSPKNAQGLMQLMPDTAERFAVADVLDPAQNVRGGVRYLRWLLSYFRGDVVLALAAYNAGEGTVDRFRGVPPYPETMAYVARIRALYPHDRHPFDPGVAEASPVVAKRGLKSAATSVGKTQTGPSLAKQVRYFLDSSGRALAQSAR